MPRIVIAGGSGFIGLNLARYLCARGDEVVILSRHPPREEGPWLHASWDARTLGAWAAHLENARAVVNLAGRTVDCIKTPDHQDEIFRSRVEATRAIADAMSECASPPPVWVQMSTAHIYGDPPKLLCDEESALGIGLAPIVAREWELACLGAAPLATRTVILRTSFVLGRAPRGAPTRGGALPRLEKLARLGLGGRTGHGKQGISWIHHHDMTALLTRAIDNDKMDGVFIATAPNPVSQADFMRHLRRAIRMPIGLPTPAWAVRLGAPLVMRTDPDLALYGRYCVSKRLKEEGFQFKFPTLESALADLYPR